jgi:NADH-quinone oxidoreductase subunit L
MFLGAGVGAYWFAIFHLVAHAFYKALLFLTAGVVIHHLGGEQDIRRMGGLRRFMPRAHIAFAVGTLALIGVPPLVGFWSKDAILASALDLGGGLGWVLFVGGLVGALLTGLYATRLYWIVFRGEPSELVLEHAEGHGAEHSHGEGPTSMLLPVGALTVLTALGGILGIAGVWQPLEEWLEATGEQLVHPSVTEDYLTSLGAVIVGLVGAALAWRVVSRGRELVANARMRTVLEHKLYFDELYDAVFSRSAQAVSVVLRDRVEGPIVQRSLDEVGRGTVEAGGGVARVQTGLLRTYALVIGVAAVALSVVFLVVR